MSDRSRDHLRGPWVAVGSSVAYEVAPNTPVEVLETTGYFDHRDATARLAAAAPDLLSACQTAAAFMAAGERVLGQLAAESPDANEMRAHLRERLATVESAIARATGASA